MRRCCASATRTSARPSGTAAVLNGGPRRAPPYPHTFGAPRRSRGTPLDLARLHAEVRAPYVLVAEQLGAGAHEHDAAVLQHVAAAREHQGLARVLLDEQHGGAGAVD